jgi:hypothetical protein
MMTSIYLDLRESGEKGVEAKWRTFVVGLAVPDERWL